MNKTAMLWLKGDQGMLAGLAVDPATDLLPLVKAMRHLGYACVEAGLAHSYSVMVVDDEEQWCVKYMAMSIVSNMPPEEASLPLPLVEYLEWYPEPS